MWANGVKVKVSWSCNHDRYKVKCTFPLERKLWKLLEILSDTDYVESTRNLRSQQLCYYLTMACMNLNADSVEIWMFYCFKWKWRELVCEYQYCIVNNWNIVIIDPKWWNGTSCLNAIFESWTTCFMSLNWILELWLLLEETIIKPYIEPYFMPCSFHGRIMQTREWNNKFWR